jgi:hypothetical protein
MVSYNDKIGKVRRLAHLFKICEEIVKLNYSIKMLETILVYQQIK